MKAEREQLTKADCDCNARKAMLNKGAKALWQAAGDGAIH
jgi:hypothetical protein